MVIFIGGMFKSGTSLARKFLGNHHEIFSGLESNWFELDQYFNNTHKDIGFKIKVWSSFFKIEEELIKKIITSSNSSEEVIDRIMSYLVEINNLKYWVDKSPPNICYANRIFNYWDNAKIIHIKRDPLDVFVSCKEAKKWDNPSLFVETWSKIFRNLKKLRENKNFLEIRYENMILNQDKTLENIYSFCELDWDSKFSYHKKNNDEYLLVKEVTGKDSTTLKRLSQPITRERIGIGKNNLLNTEINEIENLLKINNLYDEYLNTLWK